MLQGVKANPTQWQICMMLDIAVACHLRPRNSVVIITRCCDSHISISKRASADSSKQFVWRCCSNSLFLCRRKTCARQSSSHWCVLQRIIHCTARCTSCYRVLPRALFLGGGEHGAWDTCSAGATASKTCNVVSTRFLCYAGAHLSPGLSARPPRPIRLDVPLHASSSIVAEAYGSLGCVPWQLTACHLHLHADAWCLGIHTHRA